MNLNYTHIHLSNIRIIDRIIADAIGVENWGDGFVDNPLEVFQTLFPEVKTVVRVELYDYNCRAGYLVFEDDTDATAFMLRFGEIIKSHEENPRKTTMVQQMQYQAQQAAMQQQMSAQLQNAAQCQNTAQLNSLGAGQSNSFLGALFK